ncbi:MAG: glycosyltransferase family 2 protein [Terracidiphilus sp.]
MHKIYIIIVNWNDWQSTIECLESVFRLDYDHARIIVCDNASSDGSLERIADWARGSLAAGCANPELSHLTSPPCPKPIPFLRIDPDGQIPPTSGERLFLVQTGGNLFYAGGNNVGLRLALTVGDLEFAWLLNNDTVVDPEALSPLIERMEQRKDAGICGSTLLYYHQPKLVQAMGGSIYNRWTARGGHIGVGNEWNNRPDQISVEAQTKYVVGASMFVRRNFLEEIGLINEAYSIYFEEIDWAMRAQGRYSLVYAPKSIVYHKEGGIIGSSVDRSKRSAKSDYYAAKSSMKFTRKYFPVACPSVAAVLLVRSLFRLWSRNLPAMKAILCGLRDSLRQV